jgi:SAM-dependent methyltransferase
VSLSSAWENHANEWIAWARTSAHDGFWQGTWPALLPLLPGPGPGPVIDVGCGEGRAARELLGLGYRVVGVERSPTLAAAAVEASAGLPVLLGDAAAMPVASGCADLVLACMSLLDMDDFPGAVAEIGRVLRPGGRLCLAVVHPFVSARDDANVMDKTSFSVSHPYLEERRTVDRVDRDGLTMTFNSMHRPLSAYTSALFGNGMVITALTESGGRGTVPWVLALRADKIAVG